MSTKFKFMKTTSLLPDEMMLRSQAWFRFITGASSPSYRVSLQVPPLVYFSLLITNRRIRLISRLFVIFVVEYNLWFAEKNPENDREVITNISVEKKFMGKCLRIDSFDPMVSGRWYRSPNATQPFAFT